MLFTLSLVILYFYCWYLQVPVLYWQQTATVVASIETAHTHTHEQGRFSQQHTALPTCEPHCGNRTNIWCKERLSYCYFSSQDKSLAVCNGARPLLSSERKAINLQSIKPDQEAEWSSVSVLVTWQADQSMQLPNVPCDVYRDQDGRRVITPRNS